MQAPYVPQIRLYQDWLRERHGLSFSSYEHLWRWSVTDQDSFWQSIWDYDGVRSPTAHTAVLADGRMPGATWFPGAQVNYAKQVFRHADAADRAGVMAIISENESGETTEISWPDLRRRVASFAFTLRSHGVMRGDRIAACMPNIPETIVAFLACSSIGAIWSVCAPDMGAQAIVDRFRQIDPKVLIAADGVLYAGRRIDRAKVVETIRAALPNLSTFVLYRSGFSAEEIHHDAELGPEIASAQEFAQDFEPEWLPFDHPLWIVYTSGTTGMPKPIVHGHGGVLLAAAAGAKNTDVGASYEPNSFGERFHWYSTCGWIMWNAQVGGLLGGATICLYDGSPTGRREAPDFGTLWRFAARHRVTYLGAGAAFYEGCVKSGLDLDAAGDLSRVRALGTTGSPLSEAAQLWGTSQFQRVYGREVWWMNMSGGTDLAANFVGGNRELPVIPGQMQCRQLGSATEAWDENGRSLTEEVGDLVCTKPLPSMPLYFWGDVDNTRYLDSYFREFPGIWRHGDWISIGKDGSCVIYGRSDATLNRSGLRMGTSEIYGPVESLPEIMESMVIDLEYLGRPSHMELFVVLRDGLSLNNGLEERIRQAIRLALSPRFLPDRITQALAIPRTLSGKKQEVPIKKLFLGRSAEDVINRAAMANPECLDWYVEQARVHARDAAKQTAGANPAGRLAGPQSAVRNLPGSSG
ncbi:MAG TPA: acetoacetate--CoA ligase [Roseiarcus sp.]